MPVEEWAVHDYEGFPDDTGENPDLENLWQYYETMLDLGDDAEAFREYADNIGRQYATVESFRDAYQGRYDSQLDYVYQWIDDVGYLDGCPENIRNYFDYEAFTRDVFINDCFMTESGHVFYN